MRKIRKKLFEQARKDRNRKEKHYPRVDPREKQNKESLFDFFSKAFIRQNDE